MEREASSSAAQETPADAIRLLLRAVQTLRTYPADNQVSREVMAALVGRLGPALPLTVELVNAGVRGPDGDPLPAELDRAHIGVALFRDGVRRIEVRDGIEPQEIERFVAALAASIHPDDLNEDYVTRLWEAELAHVSVVAVDPYLNLDAGEGELLEGKERPEVEPELAEAHRVDLPPPPEQAFEISDADALRLAQEVEQTDRIAPWGSFLEALFSVSGSSLGVQHAAALCQLVEVSYQRCLEGGRWKMASEILRRIKSDLPGALTGLTRAAERMASSERLRPLHEALESRSLGASDAHGLLKWMLPECLPAVCEGLVRARTDTTRKVYVEFLIGAGADALPRVLSVFEQGGPGAEALVSVLARVRAPEAARALAAAVSRASGAQRRELVRALGLQQVFVEASERLLEIALEDPDRACRVIALRGLARGAGSRAQERVLERLQSRAGLALDDEEKDLLFAALGRVGDDTAVPFLRRMLKPGWLFASGDTEAWRRAADALARLASPEALRTLEEFAESRHPDLAQICTSALLGVRRGAP